VDVRLASINLNKRLGNPAAAHRLETWLHHHQVDLLIAQEPWKPPGRVPVDIPGYRALGGDDRLFAWTRAGVKHLTQQPISTFAQRIECEWLIVINTYLDAYDRQVRATQLSQLTELLTSESGRPAAVAGDFNLAPRPVDGRTGARASEFNSATDRAPFTRLLAAHQLIDTTAHEDPEFTIEREIRAVRSRFRCDLALLPDYVAEQTTVAYDHAPRVAPTAFTDHSGILLDLPVTLERGHSEPENLFDLLEDPPDIPARAQTVQPHKTAMSRTGPSPFARTLTSMLIAPLGVKSLLDHGCGRGTDLAYYRAEGLDAEGWDPHPDFNHANEPAREYDLVTQAFVLNVLPDPWHRIQALCHAARFVRPGGHLLVATRSPGEIAQFAAAGSWPRQHDGFWSHETKGTFQKGIAKQEIIQLAARAGIRPVHHLRVPTLGPSTCVALLVKPE
jgi:SAM-dependent methyltransferase